MKSSRCTLSIYKYFLGIHPTYVMETTNLSSNLIFHNYENKSELLSKRNPNMANIRVHTWRYQDDPNSHILRWTLRYQLFTAMAIGITETIRSPTMTTRVKRNVLIDSTWIITSNMILHECIKHHLSYYRYIYIYINWYIQICYV